MTAPLPTYDTIPAIPPEWTWQNRIPRGEVTVIAGEPGIGKRILGAWLARCVTLGENMPDGTPGVPAGKVFAVTPEDNPNSAMSPAYQAAGADTRLITNATEGFRVPGSLNDMTRLMREAGGVRILWIDPLSRVVEVPLTSSNNTVNNCVMEPLRKLATDTGAAVVCIAHTVAGEKVQGSRAIVEAARSVLRVTVDERTGLRIVHLEKSNMADRQKTPDVAYRVEGEWPDTRAVFVQPPGQVNLETAIIQAMRATGIVPDAQDIADGLGVPYGDVRLALAKLSENGTGLLSKRERQMTRRALYAQPPLPPRRPRHAKPTAADVGHDNAAIRAGLIAA